MMWQVGRCDSTTNCNNEWLGMDGGPTLRKNNKTAPDEPLPLATMWTRSTIYRDDPFLPSKSLRRSIAACLAPCQATLTTGVGTEGEADAISVGNSVHGSIFTRVVDTWASRARRSTVVL